MSEPIRIPLVESIDTRLPGDSKDGLASNIFYDKGSNGTIYATKRPGITSYLSGSGLAQGIYAWTDASGTSHLYTFTDSATKGSFGAYGNGVYFYLPSLTLTSKGMYSSDGLTWRVVSLPSSQTWGRVIYANNAFYAFALGGATTIYRSPDGLGWQAITMPLKTYTDMTYGSGTWVLLANNAVYSSTDGITFTARTITIQTYTDRCNYYTTIFRWYHLGKHGSGNRFLFNKACY
jgi:hypothetical protein